MIPESFASNYPHLAAALIAMKSEAQNPSSSSTAAESAVALELSNANKAGESLSGILIGLFDGPPRPNDELMRFSMAAHRQLGASEGVHVFMGRLWADAMQTWSTTDRAQFLLLIVRHRKEVFATLGYAVELFRQVQFTADEVFPWITAAQRQVGNDLNQGGLWGCIEAFCVRCPAEAVAVAERWLDNRPESASLGVISNMICWVRLVIAARLMVAPTFAALEERVQAPGNPAWRALYIQSWACAAGQPLLNERRALEIRDRCFCPDGEEEVAWCYLLNSITRADGSAWWWTHRELKRVARPTMCAPAKYWAVLAALHGVETVDRDDTSLAKDWWQLLVALLPVEPTNMGTWEAIEHTLAALVAKDVRAMREVVKILAQHSGKTWLQVTTERDSVWFFQLLRQKGLDGVVSGDLCFQPGAPSRQLGIFVFAECAVEKFDPSVVSSATPAQIELLLLESQRRTVEYEALARLHACLADRVDEIGGDLPELFYDEVSRQCLNTHHYRTALAAAIGNNEYVTAILTDVRERLTATNKASGSPALKMQVPGQARAERLHDQKLARDVAKGVKKHSTMLNLFPTIHLLYGGMEYRMFSGDSSLGAPSEMHSASSSVEVPRLEVFDPEGMHLRRVAASARISKLESSTDEDNAQ